MEQGVAENSQHSPLATTDVDHHTEDSVRHLPNQEDSDRKSDITAEEIRRIMEVIAATGKFWHDWDLLQGLLSFQLKQVLAEYPEAQGAGGDAPEQSSLSGETYPDLVRRLDEALLSFLEGPPFTLQRLCEILLDPKSTYKSLSKLAFALEKNLLVTSTMTICTDPYPGPVSSKPPADADRALDDSHGQSPVSNGVETTAGDGDEEMVEAEADGVAPSADTEIRAQNIDTAAQEAQNVDTEMQDEKVKEEATEGNPEPSSVSDPAKDTCTTAEQNSTPTEQP